MKTQFFFLVLAVLFSIQTRAAEPRASGYVNISQPAAGNLYLAGEKVTVSASVAGDVTAAGGSVRISDTVQGDVLLAGGDIDVSGYVTDDIRAFGGTLNIGSGAGGDLLVFGGTIILHRDAVISGDVIIFGGEVEINGTVEGEIKTYAGSVILNGRVNGNADMSGGELYLNGIIGGNSTLAAEEIELGNEARFEKNVRYWSREGEMDFSNAAGGARYDPTLGEKFRDNDWSGAGILGFLLYAVLASLLLSILLIFAFGRYFERGAQTYQSHFLKNFGFGVLYVIGMPVLIFILMITVIGIPLGLLTLAVFLFTLLFAPTLASVLLSYWFRERNNKSWGRGSMVLLSGGIFLALCLLIMIPFVGWLLGVILIGAAFGAIISGFSRKPAAAITF